MFICLNSSVVAHLVCAAFRNWQTAPFMEVEAAIRLLYMLGEALPASHGAHFSGDTTKTSALQDMMRTVRYIIVSTHRVGSHKFQHLISEPSAGFLQCQQLSAHICIARVF